MATTTTYSLEKPTVGGSENTWGTDWNNNADKIDDLLDGTIGITPNLIAGWEVGGVAVTSTAAELNILDGVTASAAELNILDGVTASTAELNILDGVTASTAELNYVDGVTSAIQTQLDGTVKTTGDQSIAGAKTFSGAVIVSDSVTSTADDDGTISSGTYTPTPVGGNFKRIVNGGAFTLAAPTAAGDYSILVQITNTSGAGAISNSGFTRVSGDPFTTTNGHHFFVSIIKCNSLISANVQALQ